MAGNATAKSITTGAREAQNTLVTASSEAANHVKSLAIDVERTLTAVGANTAASILGSAREAQASLPRPPPTRQARSRRSLPISSVRWAWSPPAPRTTSRPAAQNAQSALIAASNEVSSKVKSTSADIERSVLAASSNFGSTMTGKTDEIVTYVQQQTDRLAQIVDSRRGSLVEALGAKSIATHDRHRPRHLGCAQGDRDAGPGVLAIDGDPWLGRRAHHHLGRRPRNQGPCRASDLLSEPHGLCR